MAGLNGAEDSVHAGWNSRRLSTWLGETGAVSGLRQRLKAIYPGDSEGTTNLRRVNWKLGSDTIDMDHPATSLHLLWSQKLVPPAGIEPATNGLGNRLC